MAERGISKMIRMITSFIFVQIICDAGKIFLTKTAVSDLMASVMSKFRPVGLCHKTFTAIFKYLIDIKLG